jgi:transcriptional regulator with XRE-family HTH domain
MLLKVRVNSKVLWDAIARQNITQNELASRLGISSGYMSQLVCGTRCPSPRLRRKMLELLTPLTFDDLFIVEDRSGDHPS